jgi:tRNA nucleotidyltransferase/poly(A) polymerase
MLRAMKYAAPHSFRIPRAIQRAIRKNRQRVLDCSPDRLTEEFFKIMISGSCRAVMELSVRYRLFEILFPRVAAVPEIASGGWGESALAKRLQDLDQRVGSGKPTERGDCVAAFFKDAVEGEPHDNTLDGIQKLIKELALPLKISNRDSRHAAHLLQKRHETTGRKRRQRRRGGRRRSQRNVSIRLNKESTFSP